MHVSADRASKLGSTKRKQSENLESEQQMPLGWPAVHFLPFLPPLRHGASSRAEGQRVYIVIIDHARVSLNNTKPATTSPWPLPPPPDT